MKLSTLIEELVRIQAAYQLQGTFDADVVIQIDSSDSGNTCYLDVDTISLTDAAAKMVEVSLIQSAVILETNIESGFVDSNSKWEKYLEEEEE